MDEDALWKSPLWSPSDGNRIRYFQRCIEAAHPSGLVAEFGVWHGGSTAEIAKQVEPDLLWAFDSFQGLPEDWNRGGGIVLERGHFAVDKFPQIPHNVRLVEGWFSDTLPVWLEQHDGPMRFVHVDSDLRSSAETVLTLLNERIVPGTVIAFDDLYESPRGKPYPNWREGEWRALMDWTRRFDRRWRFLLRREPERAAIIVENHHARHVRTTTQGRRCGTGRQAGRDAARQSIPERKGDGPLDERGPARRLRPQSQGKAAMNKEQEESVKAAILDALQSGKDLTLDGKPEAPALSARVGFKVSGPERDRLYEQVEKKAPGTLKTAVAPDVPPRSLEPIVQIAARLMRSGRDVDARGIPSWGSVAQHVGSRHSKYVDAQVVEWAALEARRRSPTLNHVEIVAQAMPGIELPSRVTDSPTS